MMNVARAKASNFGTMTLEYLSHSPSRIHTNSKCEWYGNYLDGTINHFVACLVISHGTTWTESVYNIRNETKQVARLRRPPNTHDKLHVNEHPHDKKHMIIEFVGWNCMCMLRSINIFISVIEQATEWPVVRRTVIAAVTNIPTR